MITRDLTHVIINRLVRRFLLLLLASVLILPLLTGCAATSKASDAQDATAKQFIAPTDKGVVYLFRRGRAIAAAVQFMVKVNGIDAGGSGPGTFFRWELKPGTYTFASTTQESSAVVQLDIQPGKLYFIEQSQGVGLTGLASRLKLNEVDETTGKNAVQGMKLLVSAYVPE